MLVPMVEQWLHSMWNEGERGTHPEWGWIVLGGPNGKRLKFMVQITEYSSTMGEMRPYFEFGLHGMSAEVE